MSPVFPVQTGFISSLCFVYRLLQSSEELSLGRNIGREPISFISHK